MNNIHGTCVGFDRFGILLRGASGSGKSSLALRLIDAEGFGSGQRKLRARLVADDQVMLQNKGSALVASPPASLAGKLEIRGLGIVKLDYLKVVELRLVVDLVSYKSIPRLPNPVDAQVELMSVMLPRLALDAHGADAAAKLRAAVVHLTSNTAF